jgi:hypothetical protein
MTLVLRQVRGDKKKKKPSHIMRNQFASNDPDAWILVRDRDRYTFSPQAHHGTSTLPSLCCTDVHPGFILSATCASRRIYIPSRSIVLSIDFPVAAISRTIWLPREETHQLHNAVIHCIQDILTTTWISPLSMAGIFWVFTTALASSGWASPPESTAPALP